MTAAKGTTFSTSGHILGMTTVQHQRPEELSEVDRLSASRNTLVRRLGNGPIVDYGSAPGYGAIFNAGLLRHDGIYHLFARGVRAGYRRNDQPGPRFLDYVSDILVFTSRDGEVYEFGYVLAKAGDAGVACFEDPRVQRVFSRGYEHIVMTYTNLPPEASGEPHHIGAHCLEYDGERFHMIGDHSQHLGPVGVPNKDAVIFNLSDGRVGLIHRVHPDMQLAVFDDLNHLWNAGLEYWDPYMSDLESHVLLRPTPGARGIGAGAPPLPSRDGLLLFFHETDTNGAYNMQLALLDRHTGGLVARFPQPLLVPELEWELHGDVDNVVFVQGIHLDGEEIYLTYGAADSCVAAATTTVKLCLEALRQCSTSGIAV
jgi:predicted GH43/DUF377 family glycosyl hydrolase